jgi:hypothetical protein
MVQCIEVTRITLKKERKSFLRQLRRVYLNADCLPTWQRSHDERQSSESGQYLFE